MVIPVYSHSHYSNKSSEDVAWLFQEMFSDSQIARRFACGEKKCSYICTYGLAPYFIFKVIMKEVSQQMAYVVLFDESLNKHLRPTALQIQGPEQLPALPVSKQRPCWYVSGFCSSYFFTDLYFVFLTHFCFFWFPCFFGFVCISALFNKARLLFPFSCLPCVSAFRSSSLLKCRV